MKTMAGSVEMVGQTGSSLFLPEESPTVYLILWWIRFWFRQVQELKDVVLFLNRRVFW